MKSAIFLVFFISLLFSEFAFATKNNDPICEVIVSLDKRDVSYDQFSPWYYDTTGEVPNSRETNDWNEISISKVISQSDYCKSVYSLNSRFPISNLDWFDLTTQFSWSIYLSWDEFTTLYIFDDFIEINNGSSFDWYEKIKIDRYKLIFQNISQGKLAQATNKQIIPYLLKIDKLLRDYEKLWWEEHKNKIFQLIALKELLEDNL